MTNSLNINYILNPIQEGTPEYVDNNKIDSNNISISEILQDQSKWAFLSDLAFSDNSSIVDIKPKRKRASAEQIEFLEKVWKHTSFPSTYQRIKIGMKLNMAPRAVQIWFQNKRKASNIRRNKSRKCSSEKSTDSNNQSPVSYSEIRAPTFSNILN